MNVRDASASDLAFIMAANTALAAETVFRALFDHLASVARTDPRVCGIRLYVDRRNSESREVALPC